MEQTASLKPKPGKKVRIALIPILCVLGYIFIYFPPAALLVGDPVLDVLFGTFGVMSFVIAVLFLLPSDTASASASKSPLLLVALFISLVTLHGFVRFVHTAFFWFDGSFLDIQIGRFYLFSAWTVSLAILLGVISIAAIILAIIAREKSDAKKALAAAIFYALSLNIVSAVLCFIYFARRKNRDSPAVCFDRAQKKKIRAFVLCLFLGFFGAHRFYTGKILSGMILFMLSLLSYVFEWGMVGIVTDLPDVPHALLSFLNWFRTVWLYVDMVRIATGKFTDKSGYPLGATVMAGPRKNTLDYFTDAVEKCSVFSGRSSRTEFWQFVFVAQLLSAAIFIGLRQIRYLPDALLSDYIFYLPYVMAIIQNVVWFTIISSFLPLISLWIRRLHDTDKSGWFILLPVYNVILLFKPGTAGQNRFGEDPQKPAAKEIAADAKGASAVKGAFFWEKLQIVGGTTFTVGGMAGTLYDRGVFTFDMFSSAALVLAIGGLVMLAVSRVIAIMQKRTNNRSGYEHKSF